MGNRTKIEIQNFFLGKEEFINIQRKRPRTAFSQDQVRSLENEFARNKYLTVGRRVELSKELGLTENQVIWHFGLGFNFGPYHMVHIIWSIKNMVRGRYEPLYMAHKSFEPYHMVYNI